MKKQCKFLNLTKNSPAIDIILRSNVHPLSELKVAAFRELLALKLGKTEDEAKRLCSAILGREKE